MTKDEAGRVEAILSTLRDATQGMPRPMSRLIVEEYGRDPFLVLISCLLSLRSRDAMTHQVSRRLFEQMRTPQELLRIPESELEGIIRRIGFYRRKAATLRAVSEMLISRYGGKVPDNRAELLTLPGVGAKTASLVLSVGFDVPAICVDVHVHRISNRLGIIQTRTPEETEKALERIIPREYWSSVNDLLVMWGQNICTPQSPWCSKCPLLPLCAQRGVTKKR